MALPQREGRPTLDLTPDKTPNTASWDEKYITSMNECNDPVPERKGKPEPNGWTKEMYDVNQDKEL
jgi:hypothetical protein